MDFFLNSGDGREVRLNWEFVSLLELFRVLFFSKLTLGCQA